MKEKETKAVCPICGGELQVQGEAMYRDQHQKMWEAQAHHYCVPFTAYRCHYGKEVYYTLGGVEAQVKPKGLIQWECENPKPVSDPKILIITLTNRVAALEAALEAALAEKGGEK